MIEFYMKTGKTPKPRKVKELEEVRRLKILLNRRYGEDYDKGI